MLVCAPTNLAILEVAKRVFALAAASDAFPINQLLLVGSRRRLFPLSNPKDSRPIMIRTEFSSVESLYLPDRIDRIIYFIRNWEAV